ncbi:MAG TPA: hypothetical protein VK009_22455 [Chloroflexota bacterium]|nr:hypothetical protein [Chloroflexota bacterium]
MIRRLFALSCVLVLAACGRGSTPAATPTPSVVYAPKPTATFFIRLLDTRRFQPSTLEGEPGQLVKLVLVGDKQKHDLTSPGLNINIDVPPNQVEIIQVELPAQPGTYEFWSNQPGDREAGMTGQFEVKEIARST